MSGSNVKGTKPPANKDSIRSNSTFSWKNVGPWNTESTSDKKHTLKVVKNVEGYIIDHLYGDWYWNCSIVIGTCFFSWLVARLGGGFLSLVFVLLCTSSVYRTEYRRFNRNIRDDMNRIASSNRLENELETMEWLNSFLDKFWVIYMPALSEQVLFQANEVMKDLAPGFGIDKLSLTKFTLGSKAPRVDSIKSYTRKGHDHIEMDWAFSFTPTDTDGMTKKEISDLIKPLVELSVTVGKAFVSKKLPIIVENMSFKGRMNVKLKLSQNFPHVKMVSVQFLEAPTIDYGLKPVGGDTLGLDIMTFIPGLSSLVNGLIHSGLRPFLYAPNSIDVDVEELMKANSNDSVGCLAVKVKKCTALKTGPDTKPNSINPYVQLKIENNADIEERTKVKKAVNDPVFMETKYLLINQLESNHLNFNVFDLLADKPDDQLIGSVQFPLTDLLQKETQTGLVKNITESGKVVGKIEFDLLYFPSLPPKILDDGTKIEVTDTETGILKLNLHEARDLDITGLEVGLLNPYAEIYLNNELMKECRVLKLTNEPSWEQTFESLITEQSKTKVQVIVKDNSTDRIVGKLIANLQDIIFETSRGQGWIKAPSVKAGGPPAHFRISANWKALGMSSEEVSGFSDAAIGGLRVHIRSASDVVNLEAVGKVDPYIRVMMNGNLRAKTVTIADSLDPHFNVVYFFPVANEHQHLLLQLMDEELEGKDRSLGSCAINVQDFLKKNSEGYYMGYDGSHEIIEQPILYNGDKHGYLSYSVSFIPTLPVYTKAQVEHKDAYLALLEEKKRLEFEQHEREAKLIKEKPDEFEWIDVSEDDLADPPKQSIPLEKAIKYRNGVIVVHVLSGKFDKTDVYVHTLVDDNAYPSGVSPQSIDRQLNVASQAEAFVRDLPNSLLIFRLGKKVEISKDKEILIEKTFSTMDVLQKSANKPITLKINDKNSIQVQLEFIPSAVKLAPLDTILDIGKIKLELLSAEALPSVDSNGKSDPLCVVKLDGVEVFKTDKKRRTLDPVWNEAVEFPVMSRSRQILWLEVYDWDLTHDDELLGRAVLDLSSIDPSESTQFTVKLDTEGKIHLRATFMPEYIRPKLDATSGLPIDLAAVGAVPLKAVGGVANIATGVVGGGVGLAADGVTKGGSFIKGFGRSSKKKSPSKSSSNGGQREANSDEFSDLASHQTRQTSQTNATSESNKATEEDPDKLMSDIQSMQSEQPSIVHAVPNVNPDLLPPAQRPNVGHSRSTSDASSFVGSNGNGSGAIPGRVHIISGSGFSSNAAEVKISLKSGSKEKDLLKTRQLKADKEKRFNWNESIPFKATSDSILEFHVREKHTFGKSADLGTGSLPLALAINQQENIPITVGSGTILVNVRYIPIK